MEINPDFNIDEFTRELTDFRNRFGELTQNIKDDILRNKKMQTKSQDDLDERINDKIKSGEN